MGDGSGYPTFALTDPSYFRSDSENVFFLDLNVLLFVIWKLSSMWFPTLIGRPSVLGTVESMTCVSRRPQSCRGSNTKTTHYITMWWLSNMETESDFHPTKPVWLLNGEQIAEVGVETGRPARVLPWPTRKMAAVCTELVALKRWKW